MVISKINGKRNVQSKAEHLKKRASVSESDKGNNNLLSSRQYGYRREKFT